MRFNPRDISPFHCALLSLSLSPFS